MVLDFDATASSLIESGYAILQDDGQLMPGVRAVFSAGEAFFQQDESAKFASASPSRLEGYRPMGSEYTETPERPDLCEFFSVWQWNEAHPEVGPWASQLDFHVRMAATLPRFGAIANGVLDALRRRLNPDCRQVDYSEASYLQVNHYRPPEFEDEFLQCAHEDGHVLTILKATAPGLEINKGGGFVPVTLAEDELLLLPGSLLTLMTGGLIPPLFHRVRNRREPPARQALLYFVNPSMVEETQPWIENESNRGVSIRSIAVSCIGAR